VETPKLNDIRLDIGSELHLALCSEEQTDIAPRWFVRVMLECEDDGDRQETEIGHMEFLMVDERMVGRVFDSLDVHDGHAASHAAAILALGNDEDGPVEMPFGPYLVVETVELKPAYRGRGLGTYLTGMAIKMIGPGCNIVTVYPFPLDAERDEIGDAVQPATNHAIAAIGRSWERLGFAPYRYGVYVLDRSYVTFDHSLAALRAGL
jgi:ribosomal protein S18 acetylase RimI-like enzyme